MTEILLTIHAFCLPVINLSVQNLMIFLAIIIAVLAVFSALVVKSKGFLKFYPGIDFLKNKREELENEVIFSEEIIREITGKLQKDDEQLKSQEEFQHRNKKLTEHFAILQKVREEERKHIAREIHDELGQQLTAIKLDMVRLKKNLKDEESKEKAEELLELLNKSIVTVRNIATELRPGILDDLGLLAALDWQCKEFEKRTGMECVFENNLEDDQLDSEIATGIFRIFQETLTNIARHSGATKVEIHLFLKNNVLQLKINDNGSGINDKDVENNNSLGLLGMKERALMFGGELFIYGNRDSGTTVDLKIPLSGKDITDNKN
jgi:signal transduction histidine kinase